MAHQAHRMAQGVRASAAPAVRHHRPAARRLGPTGRGRCRAAPTSGSDNTSSSSSGHSTHSSDNSSSSSYTTHSSAAGGGADQHQPTRVPSLLDGVNWFCYSCLGLLALTDLTPAGQWLLGAGSTAGGFAARLALLQWAAFVAPSIAWVHQCGWHLPTVFKLQPASARDCLVGLAAGPALWLLLNAAVALKTGSLQDWLAALVSGGAQPAAAAAAAAAGGVSSPGQLLLAPGSAGLQQQVAQLLLAVVSPAVAEELLFRGLLLTAVQSRLGNTDAVAVTAALFAFIHLDLQQWWLFCALGGACGALAVRTRSVVSAVLCHATFNASAAVAAGLLLSQAR